LPSDSTGKSLRREHPESAARHSAVPESLLQEFILKIWQRLLGRLDIGIDDDFIEAGGDHLLKHQMILAVEKAARQRIPESSLQNICTIREIEAAILRSNSLHTELMTCAKDGRGTPLLFCHGDYATHGLYVRKLAELLTCDGPILLLHPYPNPDPEITIEQMARAYIPGLLSKHPTGAFRLIGYCNGGQLAWELASQLERSNREVELVVLIEVISLNARPTLRALARILTFAIAILPKSIGVKVARNGMRSVWDGLSHRQLSTPYSTALQNYVPSRIGTRIFCVLSEESRTKTLFSAKPWVKLS
jgi:oxalate---CoA ligase